MVFEFHDSINVAFGKGAISRVRPFLEVRSPRTVLLISSGDYVDSLGITDAVRTATDELGIVLLQDKSVVPNPRVEHVRELLDLGRDKEVDFVLAAGGGSSIDTAKAVGIGLAAPEGTDVWDYFDDTIKDCFPLSLSGASAHCRALVPRSHRRQSSPGLPPERSAARKAPLYVRHSPSSTRLIP